MKRSIGALSACLIVLSAFGFWTAIAGPAPENPNLIQNAHFEERQSDARGPVRYELTGDVEYRYLGDPRKDSAGWGVALQSGRDLNGDGQIAGSVAQVVAGIDAKAGRWFRFSVRGLPQGNFSVKEGDLHLKVEFFGDAGRTPYDAIAHEVYAQVEKARRDLSVNGDGRVGGAMAWRTYSLDFRLPFPQVDQLRVSVGFSGGSAKTAVDSEFYVDDFSLMRIADPMPADGQGGALTTQPAIHVNPQTLLPLGGRWFYDPKAGETAPPKVFDASNAQRLLYKEAIWEAPFAGNMSAWLRAGEKDADGKMVDKDRLIPDNVTVTFDATHLILHTRGVPNHPTARFPEEGFGPGHNPSYIQEQAATYYIPLEPRENPNHLATDEHNNNHALNMGPIGVAVNGIVFFNPFDMGNQDASNLMDRCCGHPNQDNLYHYHKYPICVNTPWSDDGQTHSPVIGWAFDGFPIYGPYESANLMAKDVKGDGSLNEFNITHDDARGWHYHVTPGKFPYLIGGYWGAPDPMDLVPPHHPPGQRGRPGPPGDRLRNRNVGPPPNGPPPDGPPPWQ